MPILENPKHEAFCQARANGMTLEQAYAEAGYKPARQNAERLTTKDYIKARISALREKNGQRFEITTESIARELDEAIVFAVECKAASARVAAVVAKAKLAGLMVEKQSVNVTHSFSTMTEEELRFEIAALHAEARAHKAGVQH